MRYGILSDIHGNLEALNSVLDACREQGVRSFLCPGDMIGYGANPRECLALLQKIKAQCVLGNHEAAILEKIEIDRFSDDAGLAVEWTKNQLADEDIHYLKSLKYSFEGDDFWIVHSRLENSQEFHYLKDISQAKDTFYLMRTQLCFIGHTHIPQIMVQAHNAIFYCSESTINLADHHQYIINVGSVGQPRDGNPMASFGIYDPDLKRVEIKRVEYDWDLAQRKILEAGLPEMLAQRLRAGQ